MGLFFAGYPMSEEICYIGGNVAENAGGGRAIKYGVTGRYVTGLDVVLPSGELITLGGKRLKDVTGYDLLSLMVGSEGTLGIITRVYLKLLPRPTQRTAMLALFGSAADAVSAISNVMKSGGVVPTSAEFMDGFCLREACAVAKDPLDTTGAEAAVLFESDGTNREVVAAEAETIAEVCRESKALAVHTAESSADAERYWKIRKQVAWALRRHGEKQSLEDVTIPPAALASLLERIEELAERYGVYIPVFGHAADGNIHATPLKPKELSDDEWDARLPKLLTDLYRETHRLGGTISGEHGIGNKRSIYMSLVTDQPTLALMKRVKTAFDPKGIMNPGKILPG
jgi:glycolate oxidase